MKITQDRLQQLLNYDASTGEFKWAMKPNRRIRVGAIAGTDMGNGYLRIKIDGTLYLAHRLAWLYVHGRFPEKLIDHINGDPMDNRIANLRNATNSENMQNLSRPVGYYCKTSKKWAVQIRYNGRRKNLGHFSSQKLAQSAYLKAKATVHTFCPFARWSS